MKKRCLLHKITPLNLQKNDILQMIYIQHHDEQKRSFHKSNY